MNIPENLRYTEDHEWAAVDGNVATVGVTEFAVDQLGDITLVELPDVGAAVEAGAAIGVIESVKAVSDLFSPLSGKVVGVNGDLEDAPEKVNEAPYGEGWMLKIEVEDPAQVERLLDSEGYRKHLEGLEG